MIVLLSLSVGLYELFRSKEPAVPSLQYFQLTNFADSVSSAALSPDGRMLAFKRGRDTFTGPGQIYVKLLPDGEPVEVTHDGLYKMSPVFSPDGSRIAYTGVDRWNWDTWIVPVLGGSPERMLPNASGLTWIDSQHIMFSEIKPGIYMKVSTATESRAEERDIYRPPPVEVGMAHRSYLSPDRRSVLVAEMDTRGWLPCRRVPFDGSSLGERVGPSSAKCTEAAWSPDGSWMYFSADAGSGFHLWRQHSSGGAAEQLTFGITEEQGIAVAPDGRSLITAVGVEQSSVWLHDQRGDRQISSEGYAYEPSVTPDGGKLYYLVRSGSSRAFVAGELWTADLASGRRERILPGFLVTRYDISADGNHIVFAANDSNVKSTVWLASLDRRVPPRLVSADAYRPYFDSHDEIFSLGREGTSAFIYRSRADGTGREKVIPDSVLYLLAVSPDGQWVVATKEGEANFQTIVAYQISSGTAKVICYDCTVTGPAYEGKSTISWAPNQEFLYFRSKLTGMAAPKTFVIPLQPGEALPKLPSSGIKSDGDLLVLPGSQMIEDKEMYFGPDPSVYAFVHTATQRNLYRLKLK